MFLMAQKKVRPNTVKAEWVQNIRDEGSYEYTANLGGHNCSIFVDFISGAADMITAFCDDEFMGFFDSIREAEVCLEKRFGTLRM